MSPPGARFRPSRPSAPRRDSGDELGGAVEKVGREHRIGPEEGELTQRVRNFALGRKRRPVRRPRRVAGPACDADFRLTRAGLRAAPGRAEDRVAALGSCRVDHKIDDGLADKGILDPDDV